MAEAYFFVSSTRNKIDNCFVFFSFRIKILEMFSTHNLQAVFSRLIEPRTDSLRASKIRLRDLGALTPDETLTPLRVSHLASLPVDVRIGKLMLFGLSSAVWILLSPLRSLAF